eukprot:sb/3462525/
MKTVVVSCAAQFHRKVYPDNNTLVIERADLRHSGVYKVMAVNRDGAAEFTFTVIVEGKGPVFITQMSNMTVTTGTAAQMTVTATGNPLPRIRFFRTVDGAPVKLVSATISRTRQLIAARYTIPIISLSDAGEYYAVADNEYGEAVTEGILTVVQETAPAAISVTVPNPYRAVLGDPVLLNMVVRGLPVPEINWDMPTQEVGVAMGVEMLPNGSLSIPAITYDHEGDYTVRANNEQGGDEETIRLIIGGGLLTKQPPPLVGSRPKVISVTPGANDNKISIKKGEPLTLDMVVAGNPLPSVSLTGPYGQSIPVSITTGAERDTVTGKAVIDTSNPLKSGLYTLQVTNKHGTDSRTLNITITSDRSEPEFEDNLVTLKMLHGRTDSVTLELKDGKPAPVLSLTTEALPGVATLNGNVLKFTDVTGEAAGIYEVTATNDEGTDTAAIILVVEGRAPEFIGNFTNLTLPHLTPHVVRVSSPPPSLKNSPTLHTNPSPPVSAVGLPTPEITVTKLTKTMEVFFNPDRVVTSGSTATAIVTLTNPQVSDSGWYKVTASNAFGTVTAKAYLTFTTVDTAPTIVDCIPFLSRPYGQPLFLTPLVYGYPTPDLIWTHRGAPVVTMEIGDNKTTTPSFLHVTNAALPRDNGVYTLRANNSIGEAYCSVIVMIVSQAPTFVTGLQSAQVKEGRPYTIQFVVSGRIILQGHVSHNGSCFTSKGAGLIIDL